MPTEYRNKIKNELMKLKKLRDNAGGLDMEQENDIKMNKAQNAVHSINNIKHTFRLKHIHGMANSPGTHTHVHYINRGTDIVYSAGKVVIIQDVRTNKVQRFFKLHKYEVKGLATCNERSIVCSGDINNKKPTMYIWDSITLLPLHKIRGFHSNGINHISISNDGSLILSCGLDINNSISVHRLWYVNGGIDYDEIPSNPIPTTGKSKTTMNDDDIHLDSPNCKCELLFTAPTGEEKVCHAIILRNNDFITCGPRQ